MDHFLLTRLIGSHLAADFLLQPAKGVAQRRSKGWKSAWLYCHAAIAGLLAYAFSARWTAWWIFPAVAITHLLVDRLKVKAGEGIRSFIFDQVTHVAILVACWVFLSPDASLIEAVFRKLQDGRWWIVICCYVVAVWPAGIAVGMVTGRFRREAANRAGADGAGLLIGRLERFLILTFVLLNHFEAIGFLIAAKSIFRFQEMRVEAEYIIIGSLMSFSIALVAGLLAQRLLAVL